MLKPKSPEDSKTILTDLVLPAETNPLNNLFGGDLLARMDRACGIAAGRHSRSIVVTASVNHVAFGRAVPVGSVLILEAKISRAFRSSMEIIVDVFVEDRETGRREPVNQGIYTFVAVDENGKPKEVPPVIPRTPEEKERYDAALRRRQLSLVLSGRMKPEDAGELKKLLFRE